MVSQNNDAIRHNQDIWIISEGRYSEIDIQTIDEDARTASVWEYRLSDLGRYLLNPHPIEVKKKLIGCEIRYRKDSPKGILDRIKGWWPFGKQRFSDTGSHISEVLVTEFGWATPSLRDKHLESHLKKIEAFLRPHDPAMKRLAVLDSEEIDTIVGVCEDIGGNRSRLNIQGTLDEKISYVREFYCKPVGVILEKAHISDGLFEMSGFDFQSYSAHNEHRLLKYFKDGKICACVLNSANRPAYWIDSPQTLQDMHLLEQSIQSNPVLRDAFSQCMQGNAQPVKLFFNRELEINYSASHTPAIYRKAFQKLHIEPNERETVLQTLNKLQCAISFNYISQSVALQKQLCTNISVMHDLRALEPLKKRLPRLYEEIHQIASVSEAGRFYLLDAIKGHRNDK